MTVWLFFDGGLRVMLVVVRLGEASGGLNLGYFDLSSAQGEWAKTLFSNMVRFAPRIKRDQSGCWGGSDQFPTNPPSSRERPNRNKTRLNLFFCLLTSLSFQFPIANSAKFVATVHDHINVYLLERFLWGYLDSGNKPRPTGKLHRSWHQSSSVSEPLLPWTVLPLVTWQ